MSKEERRGLRYIGWDGSQISSIGQDVRPVKNGFVIVVSKTRIFIPFSRVIDFTYDVDDTETRVILEDFNPDPMRPKRPDFGVTKLRGVKN